MHLAIPFLSSPINNSSFLALLLASKVKFSREHTYVSRLTIFTASPRMSDMQGLGHVQQCVDPVMAGLA